MLLALSETEWWIYILSITICTGFVFLILMRMMISKATAEEKAKLTNELKTTNLDLLARNIKKNKEFKICVKCKKFPIYQKQAIFCPRCGSVLSA